LIALLQRVIRADVTVDGVTVGVIGPGLMTLVCAERDDTQAQARARHAIVETGRFGAHMQVSLINDGPVTFWLQTKP
jgi:D-Tyr-tRNAtyr deacylase